MRLLSFVPCGCRAGPIDDAPPAALPAEQQLAKCSGDGGAAARRRRRRARSLGSPQWRPSLGDIYEEYSTAEAGKAGGLVPARAGKPAAKDVARVLPRAHSDEYLYGTSRRRRRCRRLHRRRSCSDDDGIDRSTMTKIRSTKANWKYVYRLVLSTYQCSVTSLS